MLLIHLLAQAAVAAAPAVAPQDGAPQQGVTHNARGDATALVVDADRKVQSRILTADRAIGKPALCSRSDRPISDDSSSPAPSILWLSTDS